MTSGWHLAQCNIARLLLPFDDPRLSEFFGELARVNAIADRTPGFVWRLQGDSGDAMALAPTPDPQVALNMSVWEDAESLFDFVYRSAHTPVMAKRRQWIEPWAGAYQALWWIEAGTIPTIDDALARLWLIDRYGPTPRAFTFKTRFPAPGMGGAPVDMKPDPWCAGNA
ncbi:DUF3291 domain-containing protein [Sphingomonas sp. LB-2]|uniref:DUF3291 domain-containing protein n=1 Tax=Sphingomonas caeni TaxID=2984949 RepID=UPI00222E4CC1|nr:DUF3291 domain-containing protein [Sphingomonas caeni]MCW3846395.1 DUF3291 domain-containing protein [Sphingomonas caeni]